jgi:hypothetical protein
MNLSIFSLKVNFLTPMIFRIPAAAELAVFALANTAQTASPSPFCRFAPRGYPEYSSSIG